MSKLMALLVALLLLPLAGCGEESGGDASVERSATEHNDADFAFASEMIPHHAQALAMVDLTLGRDLSPDLTRLTEQIRAAQTPEIETMVDWLTDWGEPIPETSRDHANSHGEHGDLDHDMPGMMNPEQMAELEAASGEEFEDLFLEMMIEHHRGAVEMADTQLTDGQFQPAAELAEEIKTGQEREIATMEGLRGR